MNVSQTDCEKIIRFAFKVLRLSPASVVMPDVQSALCTILKNGRTIHQLNEWSARMSLGFRDKATRLRAIASATKAAKTIGAELSISLNAGSPLRLKFDTASIVVPVIY